MLGLRLDAIVASGPMSILPHTDEIVLDGDSRRADALIRLIP